MLQLRNSRSRKHADSKTLHMVEPQYQPLIAFPLAWTPGTNYPVTAEPILAVMKTAAASRQKISCREPKFSIRHVRHLTTQLFVQHVRNFSLTTTNLFVYADLDGTHPGKSAPETNRF